MAARNLSASSAARFVQCPGSANLEEAIPGYSPPIEDPDKWKAKGLGTQIHAVLEFVCKNLSPKGLIEFRNLLQEFGQLPKKRRTELEQDFSELMLWTDGITMRNSTPSPLRNILLQAMGKIPKDQPPRMLRYISEAAEYAADIISARAYSSKLEKFVEVSMDTKWLAKPGKTTVDFALWDAASRRLDVVDWKTGSVIVDALDNKQLMFYAISVLHEIFGSVDAATDVATIVLHVVQPKSSTSAAYNLESILRMKEEFLQTERKILSGNLTLRPGDDCTFCPANPQARGERGYPSCPARLEMLYPTFIDIEEVLA